MKIMLIVDDYLPDSTKVAAKMMHELACELHRCGHEVTVITPSPLINEELEVTLLDAITVCRFKSGEIKNTGKIKRAINETLLPFKAWHYQKQYFKENPQDLIIYYSPSIFFGSLVTKLKNLWKCPSYLILRDLFPQWAVDQGLIKKDSLIEKYFRYFEIKNYVAADKIGLMSQKNLDFFRKTTASENAEVLYNWASNLVVKSSSSYRDKLGLNDKVVFFYGGNIGHAQDMMNIIRLAKNMKEEQEACFVLVGNGDEVDLVKESIEKESLSNVTLLPSVNQDEFKQMLAEFDVGLFTLHKGHTTHNFPGKLLGYMVQELPILGSINKNNDLKDVVESANAGLITVNGEDELFYENGKKFLDNDYRKRIGKNANMLLKEKFSVEAAAKQIVNGLVINEFSANK